jgi:hypothetical protein
MYNQWLYFFNSPVNEIDIKGKKEKQSVKKEWLDDGGMKISGSLPNNWSIILQPTIITDIYTLSYKVKNDELKVKDLFNRAFRNRNKILFKEGEIMYTDVENRKKDIDNLIKNNDILLKNIQEKIFQLRRNIYLENLKKNFNSDKIKKLSLELQEKSQEQIRIQKDIKDQLSNYILKTKSIIQNGPIPEPPIIKSLVLKIQKQIFQVNKEFEQKSEDESENETENESEDESEDEVNDLDDIVNIKNNNSKNENNISGGNSNIKIIKLS